MKIWFVPIIVMATIIGIWNTTYTSEFIGVSPSVPPTPQEGIRGGAREDTRTYGQKIIDKGVELKLVPKSNVVINGVIGAIIGWVISRILDFGFVIIRGKKKNGFKYR